MIYHTNIRKTNAEDAEDPVSLEDLKAWLQVDFDDRDDLIEVLGESAVLQVESYTNLSLIEKAVTLDVEVTASNKPQEVRLPYCLEPETVVVKPVQDDGTDGETLEDAIDYTIRGNIIRGLCPGNYSLSYTATATINKALKEAVKMEVAARYNARGEANGSNVSEGLSEAAKCKCNPYVQIWL